MKLLMIVKRTILYAGSNPGRASSSKTQIGSAPMCYPLTSNIVNTSHLSDSWICMNFTNKSPEQVVDMHLSTANFWKDNENSFRRSIGKPIWSMKRISRSDRTRCSWSKQSRSKGALPKSSRPRAKGKVVMIHNRYLNKWCKTNKDLISH